MTILFILVNGFSVFLFSDSKGQNRGQRVTSSEDDNSVYIGKWVFGIFVL